MKTKTPKTCWVRMADGTDPWIYFGETKKSLLPIMRDAEFTSYFGWLPGKRPVEVRLDRVKRTPAGRFKPDRRTLDAKLRRLRKTMTLSRWKAFLKAGKPDRKPAKRKGKG